MTGLIALDIDGTLVDEMGFMTSDVREYLHFLADQGWKLIFVTGRTFHSAYPILSPLSFPYFLAVQNGALILKMPEQLIVLKKYFDRSIIPQLEELCMNEPTDFVIYSGFENQNRCFYRPSHFSPDLLNYLADRRLAFKEVWEEKKSFENFEIKSFPSVKCFGTFDDAAALSRKIETQLRLHAPLIKDPFRDEYYVVQATLPEVNKGEAVGDIIARINYKGLIIAAGDDNNDRSMLERANIKIVMETAPLSMQKDATIIAPSASLNGIIEGLEQAINLYRKKNI